MRLRLGTLTIPLALIAHLVGIGSAHAQIAPTNAAPNPYQSIEGWAKMPPGRIWGATSAVDIDRDGVSVWVGERCGANTCTGSSLTTILKFDANGNLVKSFGAGMLVFPHGIHVDKDGNVWVTDGTPPGEPKGGHIVVKFSPDGDVLLTLGERGVPGNDERHFNQPSDVVTNDAGDIFVADGHGGDSNARIVKFDKTGKFIKTWGQKGSGKGDLDIPHAIAIDSRGRLVVGDRQNNRLQIFDQDGNYIEELRQFSRPSGVFIDKDDNVYVADSESESVSRNHDGWKRGIRVGDLKTGQLTAFIPDPVDKTTGTSAAEGVAVDRNGVVYGAEVGPRRLMRYVKK
ncbi:MAG: peptidyl-alpha-hydroxyglycine alpha-amidating lyase family protein [Bauldia sp.]